MQGLSFVVAAIVAAQAVAESQDNAYYYVQPEHTPYEYNHEPVFAQPHYVEQSHYVEQPHYVEQSHYAEQPHYETVYSPEYRHYEPEVRYVAVEPVHHEVRHEPVTRHHEYAYGEPVHHAESGHSGYVEVPEELYERYMSGHSQPEHGHRVVHEVVHEPRIVHHDVLSTVEQVGHHVVEHRQEVTHEAPDYQIHYTPEYYVDQHQSLHYDTNKKVHQAAKKPESKTNSDVTEGHEGSIHEPVTAHHEVVRHEPIVHQTVHHVSEHADNIHGDHHTEDHHTEHLDRHHHAEHLDVHHDLPIDSHHHEPEHIAEHHDSDIHDTHHEMEHGHHDTHYDSEHFYDSPMHHGGLHGHYEDPMAHEGHHSYYEDEEHVPHFTHHSEQPLTHTEEYYYGAPIHHYHHDYHHTDVSHSCWKKTAGRTAGEPLSDCPAGQEKDGALCFDHCKDGYSGVGPVCWQDCPHDTGFRDDGAYCYKPDAYGRGAGEVHQCGPSCEKWGTFFYPKCHDSFHNVGCCVCSPDCPAGMTDIGISCAKGTYSRGAGIPLICHEDQVQSGALCYPPCEHDSNGIGPICWGQCPAGTKECGPLCLGADEICSEYIANESKIAYQLVEDAAEHTTAGTVIDMAHIGSEITFPNCPNW